jgi:hypothetical protein
MTSMPEKSLVWDDPPRLFRRLAGFGYAEAAAGLLRDMFRKLEMLEQELPPGTPETLATGKDSARSKLREEVMAMLEDHDGKKLRDWMEGYQSGEPAFDEAVQAWVEHSLSGATGP